MVESWCKIVECDVIKGYGLTTSCYATVEFYTPVIYGVMGVVTFIQSLPGSVLTLSSYTDQYYNNTRKARDIRAEWKKKHEQLLAFYLLIFARSLHSRPILYNGKRRVHLSLVRLISRKSKISQRKKGVKNLKNCL